MSHFTVLVIGDNAEVQLVPFNENIEDVENPKWDWYLLGGRWTGFFKVKPGAQGWVGEPGVFSKAADEGTADQLRKADIDVVGMRDEAAARALARWDKADALLGEARASFLTWDAVREMHKDNIDTIDAAREFYHAQAAVVALSAVDEFRGSLDDVFCTREAMEKRARDNALTTFAVLKDGQWYERGEMGWWGHVADEKDGVKWAEEVSKLIDSVPDDTLFSLYDCHI